MKEKKGPPGFMIYRENAVSLMLLSAEDRAAVCYAVCNYAVNGQYPDGLTGNSKMVADSMIADVDRNTKKYKELVEQRRASANKRWAKEKKTNRLKEVTQEKAESAVIGFKLNRNER